MYLLIRLIGRFLVGFYPTDFRNLSGHRNMKLHYHDKVANHGRGGLFYWQPKLANFVSHLTSS